MKDGDPAGLGKPSKLGLFLEELFLCCFFLHHNITVTLINLYLYIMLVTFLCIKFKFYFIFSFVFFFCFIYLLNISFLCIFFVLCLLVFVYGSLVKLYNKVH